MWKIRRMGGHKRVVLSISGRVEVGELPVLQEAVNSEITTRKKVELDLADLRLVDQAVVTYLACCEGNGTRLRNCPSYIREWIEREKLEHHGNGSG
jgi:ABC-type transporter Mla MlaB component